VIGERVGLAARQQHQIALAERVASAGGEQHGAALGHQVEHRLGAGGDADAPRRAPGRHTEHAAAQLRALQQVSEHVFDRHTAIVVDI